MFHRPATLNTSALACAALVTLAMLGFVDGLARHDGAAVEMASRQAPSVQATVAAQPPAQPAADAARA